MESLLQMNKFEVVDLPGMNTLAFLVERDYDAYEQGYAFLSLEKLRSVEVREEGKIKKGFGVFNPVDKFGKNTLDYIRNIQDILVDGIKVFIAGNTDGDTSHLNKYKNEKPANSKIADDKNKNKKDKK